MDYPVPDFGLDRDVVSTQAHEKAAEESVGHVWKVDKWEDLPKVDAEFKLMQKRNKAGLA